MVVHFATSRFGSSPVSTRFETASRPTQYGAHSVSSDCTRRFRPSVIRSRGLRAALASALVLAVAACDLGKVNEPAPDAALVAEVRALAAERGITRMPDPPVVRRKLAELGQLLAFDKVLSGNRNMACITCHRPEFGTGDARSLAIGEGATGLGPARVHPGAAFEARNALPLYNSWFPNNLFWDGRVSVDAAGVFHTPAGDQLTSEMAAVMEFGPVSAFGLFPFTDHLEMRGGPGTNDIADIADDDFEGIWAALMNRLGAIPEYRVLFEQAYPGQRFDDMTFAHASNAIAAFVIENLTFNDSPWDRFLAGDDHALSLEQLNGAKRFMNAPCARCHNGPTFSDEQFHNVGLAQFGPGRGNGPSGRDDFGRMNVTGDPADIYKFRTPMLRNVELTGPYGHAGQFTHLSDFIAHYSQSDLKLLAYTDADIPEPVLVGTLLDNKQAVIDMRSPIILGVAFDSVFVREVTAFLRALTDERARNVAHLTPKRVPSGLAVDRF